MAEFNNQSTASVKYTYLVARSLLGGVFCIALCLACLALLIGLFNTTHLVFGYFCLELLFSIYFRQLFNHFNKQPVPHSPTRGNPELAWKRFIAHAKSIRQFMPIDVCMSTWFENVPASLIKKGNVGDLITYGFFYKSRADFKAEGREHVVDELVAEVESAYGYSFAPGHFSRLSMMAHLHQRIPCHYRPLTYYIIMEFIAAVKHAAFVAAGFSCHFINGTYYYKYESAKDADAVETPPVLFIHGVGLGLIPYIFFIFRFAAEGQTVIAPEFRYLTMRLCRDVPEVDIVVDNIIDLLDREQVPSVNIVAHSFGTFMTSRMLQEHRRRVNAVIMIDPVCIAMYNGKLVRNFVYRTPLSGARLLTWFLARDIHHGTAVCRNFFWTLLNLWPEDIPSESLFVVGGEDDLVPVEATLSTLSCTPASVIYKPNGGHGFFIHDMDTQTEIVQRLLAFNSQRGGKDKSEAIRHHDSASSMTNDSCKGGHCQI